MNTDLRGFKIIMNPYGQSLIQVMIAAAVGLILMLGVIQFQIQSIRENKALSEKLYSIEFQRAITLALSTGQTCAANMFAAANLIDPVSLPFDATSLPYIFSLNSLPGSGPGGNLATAGAPVSSLSSNLIILASSGIQVEVTNLTPPSGILHIHFDQSKLVRRIHDLNLPISLAITGPTTTTNITNCSGVGGGTGNISTTIYLKCGWGPSWILPFGGMSPICVPQLCPAGWTSIGAPEIITTASFTYLGFPSFIGIVERTCLK